MQRETNVAYSSKHKFATCMFRHFAWMVYNRPWHSSATRLYLLQDLGLHPAMLHKTYATEIPITALEVFPLHLAVLQTYIFILHPSSRLLRSLPILWRVTISVYADKQNRSNEKRFYSTVWKSTSISTYLLRVSTMPNIPMKNRPRMRQIQRAWWIYELNL